MQTLYPCLRYRDGDGNVAHCELAYGPNRLMLGDDRDDVHAGHVGTGWTYVAIEDTEAHHARAVAAGAEILTPPTEQPHGSLDYAARDPEGNTWNFGTYRPA